MKIAIIDSVKAVFLSVVCSHVVFYIEVPAFLQDHTRKIYDWVESVVSWNIPYENDVLIPFLQIRPRMPRLFF